MSLDITLAESASDQSELTVAFVRDVTPLLGPLYWHALRMTRHHADAEDLLQDMMLKAYACAHMFQQGTDLRSWLYRILTNNYIDAYRKRQRRPAQFPTEEITDQQLAALAQRHVNRASLGRGVGAGNDAGQCDYGSDECAA